MFYRRHNMPPYGVYMKEFDVYMTKFYHQIMDSQANSQITHNDIKDYKTKKIINNREIFKRFENLFSIYSKRIDYDSFDQSKLPMLNITNNQHIKIMKSSVKM